ncbi:MAG: hypothetical protein HY077_08115 [Elusimicrobia bacterium]|nr:hypothetical protein [Elusimicrobiota bacterium]
MPASWFKPSAPTSVGIGFKMTPALLVKIFASTTLCVLGMYYLGKGRKEHDFPKMMLGSVLILAGLFVF